MWRFIPLIYAINVFTPLLAAAKPHVTKPRKRHRIDIMQEANNVAAGSK